MSVCCLIYTYIYIAVVVASIMSCRFRLYARISVPWLSADSEVQFLDMLLLCETCPTTGLSYRELGVDHLTKTLVVWDFIDALKKDGVEAMEEIAEWEM